MSVTKSKYLLTNGTFVDEQPTANKLYSICAKEIHTTNSSRYYVAYYQSTLLDTRRVSVNDLKYFNKIPDFKQVSAEVYNKYVQYVTGADTKVSIRSLDHTLK